MYSVALKENQIQGQNKKQHMLRREDNFTNLHIILLVEEHKIINSNQGGIAFMAKPQKTRMKIFAGCNSRWVQSNLQARLLALREAKNKEKRILEGPYFGRE